MSRTAVLLRALAVPAAAAMLAAGSAGSAAAQSSATLVARANVLTPLTITGKDLDFGNVYPGVASTIGVALPAAGLFSVMGHGGANVTMTFEVPATLSGPSSATLPIGAWTAYRNGANSASSGGNGFTPSNVDEPATLSPGGTLYVFVGATVTPAYNQPQGAYTGDVKITVSYTGT